MSHTQYKQLNKKEREEIRYLCVKHGYSVRETADLLDRDPSTISRELRRNKGPTGQYGATTAHRMAANRVRRESVLHRAYIALSLCSAGGSVIPRSVRRVER